MALYGTNVLKHTKDVSVILYWLYTDICDFGICAIPATVIKVPFHLMADILLVIYLIISLAAIIVLRKDILKK